MTSPPDHRATRTRSGESTPAASNDETNAAMAVPRGVPSSAPDAAAEVGPTDVPEIGTTQADMAGAPGTRPGARSARGRRRPALAPSRPVAETPGAGGGRAASQLSFLVEAPPGGTDGVRGEPQQPARGQAEVGGAGTHGPRPPSARARAGNPAPSRAPSSEHPAPISESSANAPDPAHLLAWYDRHRRRLPWRAEPGRRADPYHVFLSEIMLQQTTVKAVGPYFGAFLARWPTVSHLAAAPLEEVLSAWAGLGYYARARNLHACARAVTARHGGAFPEEEAALLALPGIGPYTAAAIAAIAFDRKASPVDGNIERVISRLYRVADPLPGSKPTIKALAAALTPADRPGDFAQAMMDLGATICTPRSPACSLCPFTAACAARAAGDAALYPVKAAKGEKPSRAGVAFLAVRADGAVLLRTRPDKGLLAKMTEVPATPWSARGAATPADPESHAPLKTKWRPLPGRVRHVFTHFELDLVVWRADLPAATPAPAGARFVLPKDFDAEALPSLMRKVLAHGRIETAPER